MPWKIRSDWTWVSAEKKWFPTVSPSGNPSTRWVVVGFSLRMNCWWILPMLIWYLLKPAMLNHVESVFTCGKICTKTRFFGGLPISFPANIGRAIPPASPWNRGKRWPKSWCLALCVAETPGKRMGVCWRNHVWEMELWRCLSGKIMGKHQKSYLKGFNGWENHRTIGIGGLTEFWCTVSGQWRKSLTTDDMVFSGTGTMVLNGFGESSMTGWWFGTWLLFSHILGISSSQLTFIFFRG